LKFAYADPPYYGMSSYFYGEKHEDASVYDTIEGHHALIRRLCEEYPDGWALSMASKNLKDLLPLCPDKARVCAWGKPFASFKPGAQLHSAWEPVILMGGRKQADRLHCVRDWFSEPKAMVKGFPGAKPDRVIHWILTMLNAEPADEIHDLFPGSGNVSKAIESWRAQPRLFA
jgi:site-specific DNA-adenine methylase